VISGESGAGDAVGCAPQRFLPLSAQRSNPGDRDPGSGQDPDTPRALELELTELTRRGFLVTAGSAGVTAYTLSHRAPLAFASALITGPVPYPLSFSTLVTRREDFLYLRFDFFNLKLDTSVAGKPKLVFANASQPAAIGVVFAPQNIAEEAFLETAAEFGNKEEETLKPPGQLSLLAAHESRLCFQLPTGGSLAYDIASLLTWTGLTPLLVPVAPTTPPPPGQQIRAPNPYETALELPWRLILSPNEKSAWAHALNPVTASGRTELWHTRLGVLSGGVANEGIATNRSVRAVWSRDPNFAKYLAKNAPETEVPDTPTPFRMSLTERDRYDIVRLTSDYTIPKYTPEAAQINRLMLSALGGFVDLRGHWEPPAPNAAGGGGLISLEEWRHEGTLARDHYVRIVRRGYLFPFGHKAVLVKVTERKFNPLPNSSASQPRGAYLRQRYFIIVREPEKAFGGNAPGQPDGGRAFPFTRVLIKTLVTPSLQAPSAFDKEVEPSATGLFIPMVEPGKPFLFHMTGSDWVGAQASFTTPVVFVNETIALEPSLMKLVGGVYAKASAAQRTADLQGRSIALAKSLKAGDTNVEVKTMLWGSAIPTTAQPSSLDQPAFYPTMAQADVRLSAAEQVSGTTLDPTIEYFPGFLEKDFHGGDVFAQIAGKAVPLNFEANKSGGVATPNFEIGGLSRQLGPVGDLAGVAGGHFEPSKYLGEGAKLLGGILLKEIFEVIELLTGGEGKEALKLKQSTTDESITVTMNWEAKPPTLKASPEEIFAPDEKEASFTLEVKVVTMLAHPEQSTFTVQGVLKHFTINLVGKGDAFFLALQFNELKFTSGKNEKSNVSVDIGKVEYGGVLAFIKELEEIMKLGEQGPGIELEPTGITAQFSVPIPTLAVGIFAISNISFNAGVTIPFSGAPVRTRFGFSDRANPFQLQIAMFAGGGFFELAVGADGVELLEAALEFGASVSFNIGVASGGVHVMAGIYFKFGKEEHEGKELETCVLTGFLRMGGEVEVLDIISLSIELYLAFTYEKIGEKEEVIGQATLKLEVHVFIFSATIETTIERSFGNGAEDPSFAELMPPNTGEPEHSAAWDEYCNAFAPV
jgi:hypothetical protein